MSVISKERYLLFLSHAGADTEAALALAKRIESNPEAREKGLKIWIDKKDIVPGTVWQTQIENALEIESTGFAVYVGSSGVINWVESEVHVALSRAKKDASYPFIPILSKSCESSDVLPAFVRQYQGVIDVENNPDELRKLIRIVTQKEKEAPIELVDEPFLGLNAFGEKDTHLFFGRDQAIEELAERLKHSRLLMVVGDSGSGKSSLVKAGLMPRYRGGALEPRPDPRAKAVIWHILETRPRSNPFDDLADSVAAAAKAINLSQDDIRSLRRMVRDQQPQEIADALADSAPDNAKILVVVDQFEELLTLSDQMFREPFVETLLYLAEYDGFAEFRVILTMRRDYYNLCRVYPRFYGWLEDKHKGSKFSVRRMSDEELRSCIERPLTLTKLTETDVFVDRVLHDIGDQPGDLALLELALTESWRRRHDYDDLLKAYTAIGGTAGALATVADEIYENLDEVQRKLAQTSFMRLVKLGDTGGTTRRIAERDEFTKDAWKVLQRLATKEYGRLVHISGITSAYTEQDKADDKSEKLGQTRTNSNTYVWTESIKETVELSHEALVAQWPRYQSWLQEAPKLKRIHDALIPTAKRWVKATNQKADHLLRGHQLADALAVSNEYSSWLSDDEQALIITSHRRDLIRKFLERSAFVILLLLTVTAIVLTFNANDAKREAEQNAELALARQLAAQAQLIPYNSFSNVTQTALLTVESLRRQTTLSGHLAWNTAVKRLPTNVSLAHDGDVYAVQFSADGTRVATASEDKTARIWDVASGAELQRFTHDDRVSTVQFSADGTRLATASRDIRVWDVASGAELQQFTNSFWVYSLQFSADETRLAIASGDARVWDVASGAELQRFTHDGVVFAVQFSADGTHVATASLDKTARVWDIASGAELQRFTHDDRVKAVQFSADGTHVATASEDKTARVWDVASGAELQRFTHDHWVGSVQFSADGTHLATASDDKTARVWDVASGAELQRFTHDRGVSALQFNSDGTRVATASDDKTARVWDMASGAELQRFTHDRGVSALQFNSDGTRVATASDDKTARVWDMARGAELQRFTHDRGVWELQYSADETRLAIASGDVRVWDVTSGAELQRFTHDGWVWELHFSADGTRVATASNDKTARVWDVASDAELQRFTHDREVSALQFNSDGTRLAIASFDKTVRIWDVASGAELQRFTHDRGVSALQFSADWTRLATASGDAWLWDVASGAELQRFTHEGGVRELQLSADGTRLATTSSDMTDRVWDVASGAELQRFTHDDWVRELQFSADGTRLATASDDKTARVWDIASGAELQRFTHDDRVKAVQFSADGTRLATASNDKTARVWDIASGAEQQRFTHDDRVSTVQFSADGTRLTTASEDKTARLWYLDIDEILDELCGRLSRNMSCVEWKRYLGESIYRPTCSGLPGPDHCP